MFPVSMIERIEVLTDGASATYGSDAVAGVVNIITRKGFEGVELSADYRDSVNENYSINLAAGGNFDRGSANIYVTYNEQTGVFEQDYDWAVKRLLGDGDNGFSRRNAATGAPGTYRLLNGGTANFADPDCLAAGGEFRNNASGVPNTTVCRASFANQNQDIGNEERIQSFAELDYEISDRATLFVEAGMSHNVAKRFQGAPGWGGGAITISGDHPFNFFMEDPNNAGSLLYIGPEAWDPNTMQAVDLTASMRPLNIEFDNPKSYCGDCPPGGSRAGELGGSHAVMDYTRVVTALQVDLSDSWVADLSYTYSAANRSFTNKVRFNSDIFFEEIALGNWNPFGTAIVDPNLVSPKNGVSTAGNDREILSKIMSTTVNTARTDLTVIEGIVSGEAFDLPTGTVGTALGVQHRSLEDFTAPDSLSAAGENGFPGGAGVRETRGRQSVTAVFGEAIIPLNEWGEVQLAVRREDYGGSIGSTTDPKFSAVIWPTDWMSVRASFGTSFQTPTTKQTSLSTGNSNVTDNVELVNGVPTCVGPVGSFNSVNQNAGSDSLTPQTADNFNIGITFNTDNLIASADYWSFDYDNLIALDLSPQALIDRDCADDGIPNDPRILRDAVGQIRVTRSEFINVGNLETNGIDFNLSYTADAGQIGEFVFGAQATWTNTFSIDLQGDGNRIEGVGKRNFNNPFHTVLEWRANSSVTWNKNDHQVIARVRYLDDIINDQSNDAPVDSQTTLDLQYQIKLDDFFGGERSVLTLGINNVFDEDPPSLQRNNSSGELITQEIDPVNYTQPPGYAEYSGVDRRGRMIYGRISYTF